MATVTSAGTGNWGTAGTWDSGVPAVGDDVVIQAAHTVTLAADGTCKTIALSGGLDLTTYDITFGDASGAGITLKDATTCVLKSSTATYTAPSYLKSASASPTNPWTWTIEDHVGRDVRDIDLKYLICQGNKWHLGNHTYGIDFNRYSALSSTNPLVTNVSAPIREPRIEEHMIPGRAKSRIYPRGAGAASMSIEVVAHVDNCIAEKLRAMSESTQRLSLFSDRYHLPFCRLEGWSVSGGPIYERYSIRLIEDD